MNLSDMIAHGGDRNPERLARSMGTENLEAARFVSGKTLIVDGGWCAGKRY